MKKNAVPWLHTAKLIICISEPYFNRKMCEQNLIVGKQCNIRQRTISIEYFLHATPDRERYKQDINVVQRQNTGVAQ